VNASLSMTFKLYTAAEGGSALWTETRPVQVSNGSYSVLLGTVTPLTVAFDVPYFLGVTVGADPEMTPRQPLASAPYAFKAGCNPGDRITCFTGGGEPGTGCATGVRTCNAQGTGFGPCVGEVTPNCNGNCVNLQTDLANCGACNNACPTGANAISACNSGSCAFNCNAGFGNCDGNTGNGCEINITSSVNHCGACNNACPAPANAIAGCSNGACGIAACNANFANCNNNAADGCEINVATSVSNCGACGNTCFAANGTPACSSGQCQLAACNVGFANCDNNPANGCEINVRTNLSNCGACGVTCFVANGTPACSSGQCQVAACNAGFANCNGNAADGCEINTTSNVSHCGACNNPCPGGFSCSNGTCVPP
jgi:hypothetical protein